MLESLKRRIGITDNEQDDLLADIIEDAEDAFFILTEAEIIDPKYEFMIRSVALKLYARKGSEGMETETVDGYSVKYMTGLYDEFYSILDRDFGLSEDKNASKAGRVMFW